MKKKLKAGFIAGLLFLGMSGLSEASLTTIGHAVYTDIAGGTGTYNLIYDDDSPLGPITWLDYNNNDDKWQNQMDWAASLNNPGELEYHLSPGIKMNWTAEEWRLPSAGTTNQADFYNNYKTDSEMGHLFYSELGLGQGDIISEVLKASEFNNLIAAPSIASPSFEWTGYWTGTTDVNNPEFIAFLFSFDDYNETQISPSIGTKYFNIHGVAVRSGQISVVPVPGAIWLLGSGLMGLVTLRKKKQN